MALSKERARELAAVALDARRLAYAPYSHFYAGAALLCADGRVFPGCNIESASFGAAVCAERTAFFSAMAQGERSFSAIAVAGAPAGETPSEFCPPCGICRQVMLEFCSPQQFEVILVKEGGECESHLLGQLLPLGFGPAALRP